MVLRENTHLLIQTVAHQPHTVRTVVVENGVINRILINPRCH